MGPGFRGQGTHTSWPVRYVQLVLVRPLIKSPIGPHIVHPSFPVTRITIQDQGPVGDILLPQGIWTPASLPSLSIYLRNKLPWPKLLSVEVQGQCRCQGLHNTNTMTRSWKLVGTRVVLSFILLVLLHVSHATSAAPLCTQQLPQSHFITSRIGPPPCVCVATV
jgi:hypothetical protein